MAELICLSEAKLEQMVASDLIKGKFCLFTRNYSYIFFLSRSVSMFKSLKLTLRISSNI